MPADAPKGLRGARGGIDYGGMLQKILGSTSTEYAFTPEILASTTTSPNEVSSATEPTSSTSVSTTTPSLRLSSPHTSTLLHRDDLQGDPDIVKLPSGLPPLHSQPVAAVWPDEAIERTKQDGSWANFLDMYPKKYGNLPVQLNTPLISSASRLAPTAVEGVSRTGPFAYYSSFAETVPTLHQPLTPPSSFPPATPETHPPWWETPYFIFGLIIFFVAILVMSVTLQCCIIVSQRRQIEYLRDESVRSRTCPSIPSYLVRVPQNTEITGQRLNDLVIPSAGGRTLDELVDEVERRITRQLIKYQQRGHSRKKSSVVPRGSTRVTKRRIPQPPTSSGSSGSSVSLLRTAHHGTASSHLVDDATEILSVALATSSSPVTSSSSNSVSRKLPINANSIEPVKGPSRLS